MRYFDIILIFLLGMLPFVSAAQEPVVSSKYVLGPEFKMNTLGRKMQTLEETSGQQLSLAEVSALMSTDFVPWKNMDIIFGHLKHGKWFRFQLVNQDTVDRRLILEIVDNSLFELEFHRQLPDGNFRSDTLSYENTFIQREGFQDNDGEAHRNLQFRFTLAQGDTSLCLLYIPPSKYALNMRLYLWDHDYRTGRQKFFESYILLTFYVLAIIYLLLLGTTIVITRFHFFWFYFFYVLLGLVFIFVDSGLAYRYIWPESVYMQQVSFYIVLNLYLISGLQFIRKYFNTANLYRKLDYSLIVVMIVSLVVLFFSFLMPLIDNLAYAHFLTRFNNVVYVTACVILFILLFNNLFSQEKHFPGLFLFGFLIHGLSIIASSLQGVGLIPAGSLSNYLLGIGHPLTIHLQLAFMIGMLIEMSVVFYLGIKRFSWIYRENNIVLQKLADQKQKTMNALVQGIEQERERWSHELHDGLGVRLSLLKQEVARLSDTTPTPTHVKDRLDHLKNELDTAHEDLRNISHNIMPKALRKLGLRPAIEELLYRLQLIDEKRSINFYHNFDFNLLSPFTQSQLYHIVQELLHNVDKHARATEINLQFIQHEDQLIITLEDNGRGFNTNLALSKGIGLRNIKNRVSVLGGNFLLDSLPGRGTLISIEMPLASETTSPTDQ